MSRFLTDLVLRRLANRDDGDWKLEYDFSFESQVAGKIITAPVGFLTDLASVPRLPVVYDQFGNRADEPAVIHDYLYTSHETSRVVADSVFHEAMLVCNVKPWRAWCMWVAVRIFGGSHWK
jgi:hypothetical protein